MIVIFWIYSVWSLDIYRKCVIPRTKSTLKFWVMQTEWNIIRLKTGFKTVLKYWHFKSKFVSTNLCRRTNCACFEKTLSSFNKWCKTIFTISLNSSRFTLQETFIIAYLISIIYSELAGELFMQIVGNWFMVKEIEWVVNFRVVWCSFALNNGLSADLETKEQMKDEVNVSSQR